MEFKGDRQTPLDRLQAREILRDKMRNKKGTQETECHAIAFTNLSCCVPNPSALSLTLEIQIRIALCKILAQECVHKGENYRSQNEPQQTVNRETGDKGGC